MKKTTIYDIAKKTNSSAATVSRVLSNSGYPVKEELAKKIKAVAKELNYIPNMIGRQLKTNNSMTLGVIIPTISNPFYSAVVAGVEEVAREYGYHVVLCNSSHNEELEKEYIHTMFEMQVEGLIISSISSEQKVLKRCISNGLKVVAIDQDLGELPINQIQFDYRRGGYLATKHLIDKGHRKIAYVTAPLDRPSRKQIYSGYKDALSEFGCEYKESWVQISKPQEMKTSGTALEYKNGKQLAGQLLELDEKPTAIFACNDMTALGIINELTQRDVRVPDDISVIGFDNIEFGEMISPSLTTIDQPKDEMGRIACKMLLEWMTDDRTSMGDMVLKPKIIERKSVTFLKTQPKC